MIGGSRGWLVGGGEEGVGVAGLIEGAPAREVPAGQLADAFSDDPDLVRRANFDGSNVETLITGDRNTASGIALDLVADKVYWAYMDGDVREIRRADLDGSNPETVVLTRTWNEIAIDPGESTDVPAASTIGLAVAALLILGAAAWAKRGHV